MSASGFKKQKVTSDLPDPLDMLAESLDLVGMNKLEMFTEEKKLAWLIAKDSWNNVSSVRLCLSSFPSSLTESQREHFFEKFYPEASCFKEISSFLLDQCPTCVSSSSTATIDMLAPPVRECFECGSSLSAYHTCEAELYTLCGVNVVSKVTLRSVAGYSIITLSLVTNQKWVLGTTLNYSL